MAVRGSAPDLNNAWTSESTEVHASIARLASSDFPNSTCWLYWYVCFRLLPLSALEYSAPALHSFTARPLLSTLLIMYLYFTMILYLYHKYYQVPGTDYCCGGLCVALQNCNNFEQASCQLSHHRIIFLWSLLYEYAK